MLVKKGRKLKQMCCVYVFHSAYNERRAVQRISKTFKADVFYSPAQQQRESKLCVNINAGFKSLSRIFFFVGSVDVQSDPPYGKLRWAGAEREPLGDEDEERMQMSKC